MSIDAESPKRALIFGASGQTGHYLCASLEQQGCEVMGLSRSQDGAQGDITNGAQVEKVIKSFKPDWIFHLAAASTTRHQAIWENHATISTGTLHVLESTRLYVPNARVFITGSGVQFENHGVPISERDAFAATSPYAVARIHSVYAARYFRSLGIKTYVGYLFHHESPRRGPHHVSQLIVQAVHRMVVGAKEILELGDPSVSKEWTFAGDVADAILTLMGQDNVFEATLGSGEVHSIQEWATACGKSVGLDMAGRIRSRANYKAEYPLLVSDPSTIWALGWRPRVSFEDLAHLMMKDAHSGAFSLPENH
jgi:GDPmannose 4,6-dehydratase